MKIVTAAQIREMARQTVEDYHVPSLLLMENAANRVVDILLEQFGLLKGRRIAVVCGIGKNAGDGLAIARHLHARCAARVTVWLAADATDLRGDVADNYRLALAFGLKFRSTKELDFSMAEIIVDALLGTGMDGPATGEPAHIIEAINRSGKHVVAVDVPSGLMVDAGKVDGAAVVAEITVTFGLAKIGLLSYPGADYVGRLIIADIGMPLAVMEASHIKTYATEAVDVADWLPIRKNSRDANKGTFGHVVVFGGSAGFVGAPVMAAEAAARSGAGLVTLAVPKSLLNAALSGVSPCVMPRGLENESGDSLGSSALQSALSLTENASSAALGPGLGRGECVAAFVRDFATRCPVPLVIDADALNLLAAESDHGVSLVRCRSSPTILTPHPGEMARLMGIDIPTVQDDRQAVVARAAATFGCVVLLKGPSTLVAAPDGTLYLNCTGNAGMSTGGTGDVLTGVIAALLAQHLDPLRAATAAVYIHGLAGDLAASENGGTAGIIATDLISNLPRAIASCQHAKV